MRDHELPSLFGLVGGWLALQGFGFRIRLHFQFQRKDCWDSIVTLRVELRSFGHKYCQKLRLRGPFKSTAQTSKEMESCKQDGKNKKVLRQRATRLCSPQRTRNGKHKNALTFQNDRFGSQASSTQSRASLHPCTRSGTGAAKPV